MFGPGEVPACWSGLLRSRTRVIHAACDTRRAVLTLTACAAPAGATSLLAVGEWSADAPRPTRWSVWVCAPIQCCPGGWSGRGDGSSPPGTAARRRVSSVPSRSALPRRYREQTPKKGLVKGF